MSLTAIKATCSGLAPCARMLRKDIQSWRSWCGLCLFTTDDSWHGIFRHSSPFKRRGSAGVEKGENTHNETGRIGCGRGRKLLNPTLTQGGLAGRVVQIEDQGAVWTTILRAPAAFVALHNAVKRAFELNSKGRRKDCDCLQRVECLRFQAGSQAGGRDPARGHTRLRSRVFSAVLKTWWHNRHRVLGRSRRPRARENTLPPLSNIAHRPRFSCTSCR